MLRCASRCAHQLKSGRASAGGVCSCSSSAKGISQTTNASAGFIEKSAYNSGRKRSGAFGTFEEMRHRRLLLSTKNGDWISWKIASSPTERFVP